MDKMFSYEYVQGYTAALQDVLDLKYILKKDKVIRMQITEILKIVFQIIYGSHAS